MKQKLVYVLIASLITTGLLGISVLIDSSLSDFDIKILITSLAFAIYSITALCTSSLLHTQYHKFSIIGLTVSIIGLVYAIVTTWATPDNWHFLEFRFSLLAISLACAHASLMLHIDKKTSVIAISVLISLTSIALATGLVLIMIHGFNIPDFAYNILGVISIIGITATIIAPILSKTRANKSFKA